MSVSKPACKFGSLCYRKNPAHFEEYSHPDSAKKRKIADEEQKPKNVDDCQAEIDHIATEHNKSDDTCTSSEATGKISKKIETDKFLSTSHDDLCSIKVVIKEKFLVDMPEDFYEFWNFVNSINNKNPRDALAEIGLQLVGPFDILNGSYRKQVEVQKYLCHWRYYYDPPEFLTVIRGDDKTQFHLGYYRDDPQQLPVFVASNSAKENCTLSPRGENLFAAVHWFIESLEKKNKNKNLSELKSKLVSWSKEKCFKLEEKTSNMKVRDKKVVSKTFHGAGIVVPVDQNEVGYRPLPETPANLRKILQKIADSKTEEERNKAFDPLMEIITFVQFANDECDYGEGLELGIDLFCFGSDVFNQTILNTLPLAYQLLGRPQFADIITAHIANRKHTADLSVL